MDEKLRGVAQLAARIVRDDEVPGSSPGTPTIEKHIANFMNKVKYPKCPHSSTDRTGVS